MQSKKDILANLGIVSLNEMQETAATAIQNNVNTLLLAPTGTGKTLAFLMPILSLLKKDIDKVQCLILSPSRELALQIESVWKKMKTGYKVNTCYGGHAMSTEIQSLSEPPALLIGTPGRIFDHLTRQSFDTRYIHTLALDEFDKSLSMGFHEQMAYIIGETRNLKKKILISATAGIEIPTFVGAHSITKVNFIKEDDKHKLTKKIVFSEEKDKVNTLFKLLCSIKDNSSMVFCNHRDAVERTAEILNQMGISAGHYHGGMEQIDREKALLMFRNHTTTTLITTDLAARGLDIPLIQHIIHYHLPLQAHEFTHRNGRTARMHAEGTSYVVLHVNEHKPAFIDDYTEILDLENTLTTIPKTAEFATIYISGGKKNKINKIDIVGFLTKKGGLSSEDIGLIEVKDFSSYVAIKKEKINEMLKVTASEKMKGKKYKIEISS
jgi:superfamily II DNA/RNA helicase